MRKLFKKLFLFSPILLIVVFVNYFVDPKSIFRDFYSDRVADILLSGKNVTRAEPNRWIEKVYMHKLREKKDVIILGNSQGFMLSSRLFPDQVLFNHSIPSGSLEDYLAIYGMHHKKGFIPKTVVIVLHKDLLTSGKGRFLWRVLQDDYFDMMDKLGLQSPWRRAIYIKKEYGELVSFKYFQYSLKN